MFPMSRRPRRSRGRLALAGAVLGALLAGVGWLPESAAQNQLLQQAGQLGTAVVKKYVGGQPAAAPSPQPASGAAPATAPAGAPSGAPAGAPTGAPASPQAASQASPPGSPPGGIIGRVDQVGQAVTKVTGIQQVGKATQTVSRVATNARTAVQNVRSKGKTITSNASSVLTPQAKPNPVAPTPQPFTPQPQPPRPAGPRPAGAPPP